VIAGSIGHPETEHLIAAMRGQWNEVWDSFDARKNAKAGAESGAAANEDARESRGLLGAGVAAE
jgi:ribonucleoside-diphosphate reductase beta chain